MSVSDQASRPLPGLPNDESSYLIFRQIGPDWRARVSLEKLFVFGDSYSSRLSSAWEIDADDPCDTSDDATWVDFLTSSISSRAAAVAVNNYAFPGANAEFDLGSQLARFFDKNSQKIETEKATFVFFLGINDCGGFPGEELPSIVKIIFDAVHRLYVDVAARNFILVDVPPTDRSPAAAGTTVDIVGRIKEWNESLVDLASDFASNNTDATMLVFSSHRILSEVLDDPGTHGFAEHAKSLVGRGIWRDLLHLTPAVHEIIASLHVINASFRLSIMSLEIVPVADARPLPACAPSLMPFHISYTGHAPVSRYFRPGPAPPSMAALSVSSSAATLVASSSSTSVLTETKSNLTVVPSANSVASLVQEGGCGEDRSSIKVTEQVEQVTAMQIIVNSAMEVDSETQPAADTASLVNTPSGDVRRNTERFVAAFRGRQMYGQAVNIPAGYGGLVLRAPVDPEGKGKEGAKASSKPLSQKAKPKSKARTVTRRAKRATADDTRDEPEEGDDGDCCPSSDVDLRVTKKLIPSSTFASFMLWTQDRPLDEGRDEYARALAEWTRLATEIHAYDE